MIRLLAAFAVLFCIAASVTHYRFVATGTASWFHPAQGDRAYVCAMNTEPIRERLTLVNDANADESHCRIVGTGPFIPGRILDVSPIVARELGFYSAGTARIRIYAVTR